MRISKAQLAVVYRRRSSVGAGQSLVEAIVAMAILATAVAAALTLTASSLNAQTDNEGYMVATNLAREGIEVVRNIRDSNWLSDQEWDAGLSGTGLDYSAILVFNPVDGTWTLDFSPNVLGDLNTRVWRYAVNPVGIYVQAASKPNGTIPSRYFRLVALNPVCRDSVSETILPDGVDCDPQVSPKVGIRVRSRVAWYGGGRNRVAEIEETLYDWR